MSPFSGALAPAVGEIAANAATGTFTQMWLLVLPRAVAFAVAAFTLGMVFIALALAAGFVTGSLSGVVNTSVLGFLDNVLRALTLRDLTAIPVKLLLMGLLVALTCCATGLDPRISGGVTALLPRAFTRGVAAILAVTLGVSVTL